MSGAGMVQSDAVARTDLTVVVVVGAAGRALLPTMRSLDGARERLQLEVLVVCEAPDETAVRTLLHEADLRDAHVVVASGVLGARLAGARAASAELVAIIEAGDLVGDDLLERAVQALRNASSDVVAHPATVVTFGRRSGVWRQPEHDDGMAVLPIAPAWCGPTVAHARVWERSVQVEAGPEELDPAIHAQMASVGARHVLLAGTSAFCRVWTTRAPWEQHAHPLPPSSALGRVPSGWAAVPFAPASDDIVPPLRAMLGRAPGARRAARIARRIAGLRAPRIPIEIDARLADDWRAANRREPLVTFLRDDTARWYEDEMRTRHERREAARAYWWALGRLGGRVDHLFFAPWLRTGGGDAVLHQYASSVARLTPETTIGVVTTEPVRSTTLASVPDGTAVVEFRDALAAGVHRDRLVEAVVPALIVQARPRTVHAFNSTVAFDVVERFGARLAERTAIYLTTFAIDRSDDGERLSVLFLRPPGFLDPVEAVIVDSEHFVDRAVSELGYPRSAFVVQRSVVPVAPPRAGRIPDDRLRVFWAGRFDLPKRLDVLACIAEAVRERALPVDIHFYGVEVMGTPGLDGVLARLAAAGAVRHPPYSRFADLPLDDFDAFVLTSEWEGVPLVVLEAMANSVPVVAPLVGGVGEVLDETTGYPVGRFDDVESYLEALRAIIEAPASVTKRTAAAREVVSRRFSDHRFEEVLGGLPGYLP